MKTIQEVQKEQDERFSDECAKEYEQIFYGLIPYLHARDLAIIAAKGEELNKEIAQIIVLEFKELMLYFHLDKTGKRIVRTKNSILSILSILK